MRLLADDGVHVVAPYLTDLERDPSLPAEAAMLDVEDPVATAAAMAGCGAVVHLAARSGGIQFQGADDADVYATNRRLTESVLAAASQAGVGRVFLASSAVIYRNSDEPLVESDPLLTPADRPTGYAWSKLADEVAAAWWSGGGGETVIGRFSNVYGPGASFDPARSTVVHALVRRAVESVGVGPLTVWGDGTAVRSFVHAEDTARAVVTILAKGEPGGIYNVDSGIAVSIRALAELVAERVDPALALAFDASKAGGQPVRVLDVTRLRAIGFEPEVELADGIAGVVEAFRASQQA